LVYIAGVTHVTILNLNLEIISSWKLPALPTPSLNFRGLKVENTIIYLTVDGIHQIFLCNTVDGKILNKWGSVYGHIYFGLKHGEFSHPRGLTLNNKYTYICDCFNHRIQILTKEKGHFISQWGNEKFLYKRKKTF